MLSGEYFVLDGALALALPTWAGQTLRVGPAEPAGQLQWDSFDEQGRRWFSGCFMLPEGRYIYGSDEAMGRRLESILQAVTARRSGFWTAHAGYRIETRLDFPREWGLGTSSTLLSLIAQWTGADPYALESASFGGSGYDLACSTAPGPILYQRSEGQSRHVVVPFSPPFHDSLYFVYLGRKQDSRAGIARYREQVAMNTTLVERVSRLTMAFCCSENLDGFEALIRAHEELVSGAVSLPRAKELYFSDFWGEVKSLGAWGGDFVLLTSRRSAGATRHFLQERGFDVVLPYASLIKTPPSTQTK